MADSERAEERGYRNRVCVKSARGGCERLGIEQCFQRFYAVGLARRLVPS